jgi:hypothetical protein
MKKLFRTKNLLSEGFLSPSFVEYDDCVFLASQFSEESYRRWSQTHRDLGHRKSAIEVSMNHVHVSELFITPPAKVTVRLAREAGETICDAWRLELKSQFPNREFHVSFSLERPPEVSEVTFCQERP